MQVVTSLAELPRVLRSCEGGETVSLVGTFDLDRPYRNVRNLRFDTPVTIDMTRAVVNGVWYFRMLQGLEFRGGIFNKGRLRIDGATNVSFRGVSFADGMGITIIRGRRIEVADCRFERCGTGVGLSSVEGYLLDRNNVLSARSDGFQAAGSSDGRITRNVMRGMRHIPRAHPDGVQMWGLPPGPMRNLVLEDNLIEGDCQGIFLPGNPGAYENVALRRNRIRVTAPNAIYCGGMKGLILEDNEIVRVKGAKHGPRYFISYCEDVQWLGRNTLNGKVVKNIVSRRIADYARDRAERAAKRRRKREEP